MKNILKHYADIVPFLGEIVGEHCEVVLQDISPDQNCIVAIANGHVSGRRVGSPLTNYALRLVTDGTWKHADYSCNYPGRTLDGKQLRSSTYFIKEGETLIGMLCVNAETQHIKALSDAILKLGGLNLMKEEGALPELNSRTVDEPELFYGSVEEISESVISDYFGGRDMPRDRLTQEERLDIVARLEDKGVFMLKGAVSSVSKSLHCSEASVYRYLSILHKMQQTG